MPFKSESQKRRFRELVAEGKMSQETYDKWESETTSGKLPERATKKGPATKRPMRLHK